MDKKLSDAIFNDIKVRNSWAERQAAWYTLRREGFRRKNKPFPGAADMHYPLIDSIIDKFKPFYRNQLFATERLADMVSKNAQAGSSVTDVEWWFDYKLKQKSNLEKSVMFIIDTMLQNGRGISKVKWDAENNQLHFESIEPIYIIVPPDTEDLCSADRIVHVQHFSVWKYKHGVGHKQRNQSDEYIKRIQGNAVQNDARHLEQEKARKEGITYSANVDTIILWEVYERTKEGFNVYTVSPSCPEEDARAMFTLPYKHGHAPFADFTMEECESSYYSPRGVAEICAPYQSSLTKTWNEKHDAMTYYNRPIFSADRDIPNAGNLRMRPGDILPFAVRSVERGAPPISWDDEMRNTRAIAEQRIAIPDFGAANTDGQPGKKTATQIDAEAAVSNSMIDMRSAIFRRQLAELYYQAFELLKQYDTDFEFLREGDLKKVDRALFEEVVTIRPNGSGDSWNQQRRLKKAITRKQLLGQSPYINQGELDKSILELDEPDLVKRLYIDPQIQQQNQAQRQILEIPSLEEGLPLQPNQDDDDAVHANVLLSYFAKNEAQDKPVTPEGIQALQSHLAAHMARLQQTNPQAARILQQQGQQMMQQAALQAQQRQQGPQVVQPQPEGIAA